MFRVLLVFLIFGTIVYANHDDSIERVSLELKLIPASKAVVQWERVFSSESRMTRYHIDQLSPEVQEMLKQYLIEHAADSSQPMVPGL